MAIELMSKNGRTNVLSSRAAAGYDQPGAGRGQRREADPSANALLEAARVMQPDQAVFFRGRVQHQKAQTIGFERDPPAILVSAPPVRVGHLNGNRKARGKIATDVHATGREPPRFEGGPGPILQGRDVAGERTQVQSVNRRS